MMLVVIFLLSIGLFAWFLYTRQADLAKLPMYFRRVDLNHLIMLALMELLFLVLCAESNRLVYRSLGVENGLLDQMQLLLAAGTIERLLPSVGAAGMSSYVMLAKNRGIPVAESLKMTATTFVLGYAQVVPLLLLPIIVAILDVLAAHDGAFGRLLDGVDRHRGASHGLDRAAKFRPHDRALALVASQVSACDKRVAVDA